MSNAGTMKSNDTKNDYFLLALLRSRFLNFQWLHKQGESPILHKSQTRNFKTGSLQSSLDLKNNLTSFEISVFRFRSSSRIIYEFFRSNYHPMLILIRRYFDLIYVFGNFGATPFVQRQIFGLKRSCQVLCKLQQNIL